MGTMQRLIALRERSFLLSAISMPFVRQGSPARRGRARKAPERALAGHVWAPVRLECVNRLGLPQGATAREEA